MKVSLKFVTGLVSCLILSGCTSTAPNSVITDIGVSGTQIHVGFVRDSAGGNQGNQAQQFAGANLYFAARNSSQKVCGRDVVVEAFDSVAASKDAVVATLTSSEFNPIGSSPAVDVLNGLTYLLDTKKLAKGDVIGIFTNSSDESVSQLLGANYFATKSGLSVVSSGISGTETDLNAAVLALRDKGAKALIVPGGQATLSAVVSSPSLGAVAVPVLADARAFEDATIAALTPNSVYLQTNVVLMSEVLPVSSDSDATRAVAQAYVSAIKSGALAPSVHPGLGINVGWAEASILTTALDRACGSGSLTREAVSQALAKLGAVSTGVGVDLDYGKRPKLPSAATILLQPAQATFGKTSVLRGASISPLAGDFYEGRN